MTSRKNIVRFPGNPIPAQRRASSATVITLPVIRIERYEIEDEIKIGSREGIPEWGGGAISNGQQHPQSFRRRKRLRKLIVSNEGAA